MCVFSCEMSGDDTEMRHTERHVKWCWIRVKSSTASTHITSGPVTDAPPHVCMSAQLATRSRETFALSDEIERQSAWRTHRAEHIFGNTCTPQPFCVQRWELPFYSHFSGFNTEIIIIECVIDGEASPVPTFDCFLWTELHVSIRCAHFRYCGSGSAAALANHICVHYWYLWCHSHRISKVPREKGFHLFLRFYSLCKLAGTFAPMMRKHQTSFGSVRIFFHVSYTLLFSLSKNEKRSNSMETRRPNENLIDDADNFIHSRCSALRCSIVSCIYSVCPSLSALRIRRSVVRSAFRSSFCFRYGINLLLMMMMIIIKSLFSAFVSFYPAYYNCKGAIFFPLPTIRYTSISLEFDLQCV